MDHAKFFIDFLTQDGVERSGFAFARVSSTGQRSSLLHDQTRDQSHQQAGRQGK